MVLIVSIQKCKRFLYINFISCNLINSLISSSLCVCVCVCVCLCVYVVSVEFSMYNIMSSANSDSLITTFPVWIPFISFSVWLLWLRLLILP